MNRNYFAYNLSILISLSLLFSDSTINKEIDELQENSNFKEALELCKEHYNPNDVKILWRVARSYFDIADQSSDIEIQKKNIDLALPHAKKALEIDPLLAKANHWYAVIIG